MVIHSHCVSCLTIFSVLQVDGEGHFDHGKEIHGIPIEDQQAKDRRFDALAIKQNFKVLRLGYKDEKEFSTWIVRAIAAAKGKQPGEWPMFSTMYS